MGPAPEISDITPDEDALKIAIDFGEPSVQKALKHINRKNSWTANAKILEQLITDNSTKYENRQLTNAVMLYQYAPLNVSESIFTHLVSSPRPLAKQLGWQLAAAKPSKGLARAIDKELSRAVLQNEEESTFLPQMAAAVKANRLASSYTLLRMALFQNGNEAFVTAMSALNPKAASEDFLVFLAQVPPEELRQLTLTTVDVYAAMSALKHLQKNPASISNPHMPHLFYYAVSRNPGVSETANSVLDSYYAFYKPELARMLSLLPAWVQVAYVESTRRNNNPQRVSFLLDLKKVTTQSEVAEELNEIR